MRHGDRGENDAGDFFSIDYLLRWLHIMRQRPRTRFYAYTKEVSVFRVHVEPDPPSNFWWVYSYGGTQDEALNAAEDPVADVFRDEEEITRAGWHSQAESDLLAVLGPRKVGIPANNIARGRAEQAGRRWSEWQASVAAARRERLDRPATTTTGTPHTPAQSDSKRRCTPDHAPHAESKQGCGDAATLASRP